MLRRKGSKIVRLSVYEGRSVEPDTSANVQSKRRSDDGETLGSALTRMKDSKRKGPTPLIGELSFENDEPAKPRSQPVSKAPIHPIKPAARQGPLTLSKENLAAYAASAIGVSSKPPSDPGLAQLAYAASAFVSHPHSKPGSSIGSGIQGSFPFPMPPASLPPVPIISARGFPASGMPVSNLPQGPSALGMPAGPSSTLSGLSNSRAHVLGAQLRGAQMLGASQMGAQSNISLASNKSASGHKRTKSGQNPSPGISHVRRGSQPHSAKTPKSVPMSRIEDNFISMTPARSDISSRSSDKGHSGGFPAGAGSDHGKLSSSVPAVSHLPGDGRAAYKSQHAMRSSTAPLPPLPDEFAASKPLPLRESVKGQPVRPSRTSAHRPLRSLTVDTDSAREQAKRQMYAKQMAAEQKQKVLSQEGERQAMRASAVASGRTFEGGSQDFDGRTLPFGGSVDGPKTGTSPFDKMASVFTPKRPSRKESASELPARVPRPPSAEPLDPALDHFTGGSGSTVRRDSTASNNTSVLGKSKGINRLFGFGKNKVKVCDQGIGLLMPPICPTDYFLLPSFGVVNCHHSELGQGLNHICAGIRQPHHSRTISYTIVATCVV